MQKMSVEVWISFKVLLDHMKALIEHFKRAVFALKGAHPAC